MKLARLKAPCQHAPALSIFHDQVDRKVLDEKLCVMLQRLLIQCMEDRVTRSIRRRTGPLRLTLPKIGCHSAKCALVDLPLASAGKRDAIML